jgi:NAD(P)-dependent dehydrogenase (short-subunit alcohol dehydrogenase family)
MNSNHACCLFIFYCILQGFELHYAVNFLGHFALTQYLPGMAVASLLEQRSSPPTTTILQERNIH